MMGRGAMTDNDLFAGADDWGFTLAEILICMPICLCLLTALVAAYGALGRNYIKTTSQWVHLEEIRVITNLVHQRVRYATGMRVVGHHQLIVQGENVTGGQQTTLTYYQSTDNQGVFLVNGQPISNNDRQKYVNIRDITFEQVLPHRVVMRMTLENRATGQASTLETGLYSYYMLVKAQERTIDGQGSIVDEQGIIIDEQE